jgi:hypothetical protein
MPRPGIHLSLRNVPVNILSKSFVAWLPTIANPLLRVYGEARHHDLTVDAAFTSFARAMRARVTSANLAIA